MAKRDAGLMLEAVCNEQALRLDMQLQRIEQAVTTIYHYADEELTSAENLGDEEYRYYYLKKVQELAYDIAKNTEGTRTVYFRMNPEIVAPWMAFFW